MSRNGNALVGSQRKPPAFFEKVRRKARERWDQLEADPELAGPWQQLFKQVQSPRHVLSELLQNADDAGAKWASARIEDDVFVFEHDGSDFDDSNFASLCRFGFSNKRNLHTIGFRGVGFKSTFSLGPNVQVLTPSLSVRFAQKRFTEPIWDESGHRTDVTSIRVRIKDSIRKRELEKNLNDWAESPASLLFFRSIKSLNIRGQQIDRRVLRKGPVPRSEWIELSGAETHKVLRIRSETEAFPDDAVTEIRQERIADDISLPPCEVEIVLGLPEDQRLYVVLPTGVEPNLPFSCNAPFLQDPARTGLKDPTISPTNQWLLGRIGKLVAQAMKAWLRNSQLSLDQRAAAYDLLPGPPEEADNIADDCAKHIAEQFQDECGEGAILLTTDGDLVERKCCVAPPDDIYDVWNPKQIAELFGIEDDHVACREIPAENLQALEQWDWIDLVSEQQVIERLKEGDRPRRPREWDSLLRLWTFVQDHQASDYGGYTRRQLRIVPVKGETELFAANEVVRLSTARSLASEEDWDFLARFVLTVDRNWLDRLSAKSKEAKKSSSSSQRDAVDDLLQAIGLDVPTSVDRVISNAAEVLCEQDEVLTSDLVRIAKIAAVLDADIEPGFKYVVRNRDLRNVNDGVVADLDGSAEELLPKQWIKAHVLHEDYAREHPTCTREQWRTWVDSTKSGLRSFALIGEKAELFWSSYQLEQFLRSRQAALPASYPYKRGSFPVVDYDFDQELVQHWTKSADSAGKLWSKILGYVADDPLGWANALHATVRQNGNTYSQPVHCGPIPAAWVDRFRKLKCLPDTLGKFYEPAELLMRSPDTEPLMGVERFVRAELDTPDTKPLLKLLGVRDTSAGTEKLIQRIRDLSDASEVPITETLKWYDAIDRVLGRARPDDLAAVTAAFRDEALIITEEGEWATSQEVFRLADEDALPGAPRIHPSAANLSMWGRIGVAERPSPELILGWLQELDSGEKLDGTELKRCRNYIAQLPTRVWSECAHWLALDGSWAPVTSLDFGASRLAVERLAELFPNIKARTADLKMLSAEWLDQAPFASLKNLGASLQYRVTEHDANLPPAFCQKWLLALAQGLQRVQLSDDDRTLKIWEAAERLERTAWQPFITIRVTPYIDGTPVGQAHSPPVLWHEHRLFVKEGPISKLFKTLVDELARPFEAPAIVDAIQSCIDRSESWIEEYLESNFQMAPKSDQSPLKAFLKDEESLGEDSDSATGAEDDPVGINGGTRAEKSAGSQGVNSDSEGMDDESGSDDLDATDETEPQRQRREREPKIGPTLISRYAAMKGFRWNSDRHLYRHSDGSTLKSCDPPFQWERYSSQGVFEARFWVSEQCLIRNGVEINADIWEGVRRNPTATSLILLSLDNRPMEIKGSDLMKMIQGESLQVFASKYRLQKQMS